MNIVIINIIKYCYYYLLLISHINVLEKVRDLNLKKDIKNLICRISYFFNYSEKIYCSLYYIYIYIYIYIYAYILRNSVIQIFFLIFYAINQKIIII